jgi:hypothetical protein
MQAKELASLVQTMRRWQQEYFRDRDGATLETCKRLERQVDAAVTKVLSPQRVLAEEWETDEAE